VTKIKNPVVVGVNGDAVCVVDAGSLTAGGKVEHGALCAYTLSTDPVAWSDEMSLDVLLRFVPFYDAKERDLSYYGYTYPSEQ
jgi:hypothetical protein